MTQYWVTKNGWKNYPQKKGGKRVGLVHDQNRGKVHLHYKVRYIHYNTKSGSCPFRKGLGKKGMKKDDRSYKRPIEKIFNGVS